jgi:phosphoribosylformimino-5-aminoimidazole carboxamide ribotide isomerase
VRQGDEFQVVPAVDVLEGRSVRLAEGDRGRVTAEGGSPEDLAACFVSEGARRLHLVDLDGAFSGTPTAGLVERVVAAAGGVPVQVGGGLRTPAAIESALAAGADRVLVGTAALTPEALPALVSSFGGRLVVAVDVRDGHAAAEGWTRGSRLRPEELARRCADAGVSRLLVTATRRDGTLAGPDIDLLAGVLSVTSLPVLAAGGISSLGDLAALRELGCEGAVVGTALLTGRFTLGDAARVAARAE